MTAPEGDKIQNFRQTKATETSITVSWKKCAEANAYQLTYGKRGGDLSGRKTVLIDKATSYTVRKLSRNAEYNFWICPVKKSADGFCALSSYATNLQECPVLPAKVKGVEASFWSPTGKIDPIRPLARLRVSRKINISTHPEFQETKAFQLVGR